MNPYVMQAVATERIRDMHRAADRSRRAALARPARRSWPATTATTVGRTVTRARDLIRRQQLGPVDTYCATC